MANREVREGEVESALAEKIELVSEEDALEMVSENNALISDEEELKELVGKLCASYKKAESAMEKRNTRVKKWRLSLESIHAEKSKDTPFKNSSNINVPMTSTISQGLYAKVKGMFDAREPFWTAKALQVGNQQDVTDFKALTRYLEIISKSPYDLNLEEVKRDLHLETSHIGTCFVKVPWTTRYWNLKKEEEGLLESKGDVFLHDGPEIIPIPIERVKYPKGKNKIADLPWISVDYTLTEEELREREARGTYDNIEDVLSAGKRENLSENEEAEQKNEDLDYGETVGLYDIVEFYVFYDYDKDGIAEDLILTIHPESETCLKQQVNSLGIRDLVTTKHMHRSFSLTGRGVGQMTESLQEEMNGIHNLRNDNMKVANLRMIAVKRGSQIGLRENVYPGKIFQLDNPREDINPIQLGEVYPSSLQAEENTMQYAHQVVGLSTTQLGFESQVLGTRDSGTMQKNRMQAGDTILTSIAEGLVDSWSKIGMLVFMQLARNKDRVMRRERMAMRLSEEELESLERVLGIPFEEIPFRISFSIKVTTAENTFENQRQNKLMLNQMYTQFVQQVSPVAMQIFGPQSEQMLMGAPLLFKHLLRSYIGSCKIMGDVFKFFGEENPDDYVPDVKELDRFMDAINVDLNQGYLQKLMQMQMMAQQMQAQGGGMQGQPPGQPPGSPAPAPEGGMM